MDSLQLIKGNLWEYHCGGDIVAVTIGGLLQKNGLCVMPSGCARQAAELFPALPSILGEQIKKYGLHVFDLGNRIVSFPVENDPFENPDLKIIEQSCHELVELVNYKQWKRVVVPRPGCGRGGLSWNEVEPILKNYFDARFYLINDGKK